jgi:hypothetical protein
MLDQAAIRVGDVVKNFSGVNQFTFYDDITIRGFRVQGGEGGVQLLNGLRTTTGFWKQPLTNYLERVEVIKGPSGVLFGNSSPGGTINRVTKKPLTEKRQSLSFTTGSFPAYSLLNAALYYQFEKFSVQVNVNNLTNKTHWVGGYDYLRLFPGAPRNWLERMRKNRTLKQKLRSSFLWLHRWLGLISGIVVFVVSVSGGLYVFEEEGRDLFQKKFFYVAVPVGVERKPLHEITAAVKEKYPCDTIAQIRFKEKANAAIVYHTKTEKAISVNPYTLEVTGVRNLKTDFFNWILQLHMNLQMGKVGNEIIKWNVLIFFIMCITGLIVWWPKQKRF